MKTPKQPFHEVGSKVVRSIAGATLLFISAMALAQTSDEQPRTGVLEKSGPAEATHHNAWSRPAAMFAPPDGWESIKLIDINSDGFDDLCGVYGPLPATGGSRYGCVLNTKKATNADPDARVFAGNLIVASAFNGSVNPSVHSTIGAVDMQVGTDAAGNPIVRRHLCGRTAQGIKCHRFEGAGFQAGILMQSSFSDANGWNQPQYYKSITFARLEGFPAVCGRGTQGILCYLKVPTASTFSSGPLTETSFSDNNGWNQAPLYETLRFVDVNGDGHIDVCGRGYAGVWCSRFLPSPWRVFERSTLWTTQYADGYGWNQPQYYKTIRFADVDGDGRLDVCGRGIGGLYCERGNGSRFVHLNVINQSSFADALGWPDAAQYYESISLVRVNDDSRFDVCGVNKDPGGNDRNWKCAAAMPTPLSFSYPAQFEPQLIVRTGDVVTGTQTPVAGRIHAGGRTGICWTSNGEVRCSNRWIW